MKRAHIIWLIVAVVAIIVIINWPAVKKAINGTVARIAGVKPYAKHSADWWAMYNASINAGNTPDEAAFLADHPDVYTTGHVFTADEKIFIINHPDLGITV